MGPHRTTTSDPTGPLGFRFSFVLRLCSPLLWKFVIFCVRTGLRESLANIFFYHIALKFFFVAFYLLMVHRFIGSFVNHKRYLVAW